MFGLAASFTAALLLTGLSAYLILKERTAGNVTLCVVLLLLAGAEVVDQLSLNASLNPEIFRQAGLIIESFLPLSLLCMSVTLFRQQPLRSVSPVWWLPVGLCVLFPVSAALVPVDDFIYAPDLREEGILFLGNAGYWFYTGIMVFCVLALANLEIAFSATSGRERWSTKFEFIGIVSILSVLIFYFSQGLLYRTINMNLIPVRAGVMVLAAVMIGYSRFFRGSHARVAVSRYVLYRSMTLLLVGAYLLLVGLVGGGLSYFGVSFGRQITALVAFIAGAFMLLVLFSEKLRRRVRVFVSKHFYAQKYDYREEWLKFTSNLASCKTVEDVQMTVLTTFRETFLLNRASLYLVTGEGAGFELAASLPSNPSLPQSASLPGLYSYFLARGRVFNAAHVEYVPTAEESEFAEKTGANLIVPLVPNGSIVGLIVLGEQMTPYEFIYEDYDLMKTLGKQAALSVVNFRLSEELAEAREIAAIGRISSYVVHDLKNLTYGLSLLLENAEEYSGDADFQSDMLQTIRNTVVKMGFLSQRLRSLPEKGNLERKLCNLAAVVDQSLVELKKVKKGLCVVIPASPVLSMVDASEISKVVLNLAINGFDASGENGTVTVETGVNGNHAYIEVKDNGSGMSEDYVREHLFKPFRTTKRKGLGIGLYQCKQIVEAHEGNMEVLSMPGRGTTFTVYLPLASSGELRESP